MGVVTAKSPREDEVRSARERLIADGLLRAAIPASACRQGDRAELAPFGLVPHRSRGRPRRSSGKSTRTASFCVPQAGVLDQWQTNLADSRLTLFLADEDGRIVSRRIVDAQDERTMDRANAVEGFDFSEQALGTNGLGTPIEARGVVFVRGAEHFNDALDQLACAGAPIKHPITGRIVGSLALPPMSTARAR